jgi:hypothetical protein
MEKSFFIMIILFKEKALINEKLRSKGENNIFNSI